MSGEPLRESAWVFGSSRSVQSYPPIIAGFVEGLLAPIFELLIIVLAGAFSQASQTIPGAVTPLYDFLLLIFVIDLARNVLLGLSHSSFALGNLVGNLVGLYLFYSSFSLVSSEAANDSLLFTLVLLVSYIIGVIVTIRSGWE